MTDRPVERVYLLLGTYDGAAYLAEQLRSLRRQTFRDWRLLIRDDGSSDATLQILEAAAREDHRLELLKDDQGRLGATGNFGRLMRAALEREADLVCFTDQDDVWLPDKLAEQVALLRTLRAVHGADTPLLVHSDLEVVDANLATLHESFMRYQGIRHPSSAPLNYLLAQNFVTGCTLACNRPLLEIAVPIPAGALIHDWWVALCAAVWGRIDYIDHPTVLYRQHGRNQVGAKRIASMLNPLNQQLWNYWRLGRANFRGTFGQAAALRDRLHSRSDGPSAALIDLVDTYAGLPGSARLGRLASVYRAGIRRQGWIRQFLFCGSLLLEPRSEAICRRKYGR